MPASQPPGFKDKATGAHYRVESRILGPRIVNTLGFSALGV